MSLSCVPHNQLHYFRSGKIQLHERCSVATYVLTPCCFVRVFYCNFPTESLQGACTPETRDCVYADYSTVCDAVHSGVIPSTRTKMRTHRGIWTSHCATFGLDPTLKGISDPIPLLHSFDHRVRTGEYTIKGVNIQKRLVEQYLRSVGQAFSCMEAADIRLGDDEHLDFCLRR